MKFRRVAAQVPGGVYPEQVTDELEAAGGLLLLVLPGVLFHPQPDQGEEAQKDQDAARAVKPVGVVTGAVNHDRRDNDQREYNSEGPDRGFIRLHVEERPDHCQEGAQWYSESPDPEQGSFQVPGRPGNFSERMGVAAASSVRFL